MSSTPKINLKKQRETILKSRATPTKISDSQKPKSKPVVIEEKIEKIKQNNTPIIPEETRDVVENLVPQESAEVSCTEVLINPDNKPETCEVRDGNIVCPVEIDTPSISNLKKDAKSKDYDKILNICNSGISSIQGNIEALKTKHAINKSELKSLNEVSKYLDNIRKYIVARKNSLSTKNTGNGDDRKKNMNSGFLKKKELTQETIDFFGLDSEPRSRVDMTRLICSYVRDKQLQDPENRKQIILDEPMKKLLKYDGPPSIPYFDVQKHFKNFFVQ